MDPERTSLDGKRHENATREPGTPAAAEAIVVGKDGLGALLEALAGLGYHLIGPTVRDGAIVLDEISGLADLPAGWGDEQDGGVYRLRPRDDGALFGFSSPAHAWKRFLHPPKVRLWQARRTGEGHAFTIATDPDLAEPPLQAFIGVRACDLRAIAVLDRVFGHDRDPAPPDPASAGAVTDPTYHGRRSRTFVLAVNCGQASGTCFCASMGSGPGVSVGPGAPDAGSGGPLYDIALTERIGDADFLLQAGSSVGAALLARLPGRSAGTADLSAAAAVVDRTAASMGRHMDPDHVRLLNDNMRHPRWEEVARRCLSCGNCTMACPTCFCSTVEDTTDLTGATAERWRLWDSCFTLDFSYIHGGSIRTSTESRYRQWISHKLATWHDQFGTSGCVGCGRCIAWCPVGIDITEEVAALRASEQSPRGRAPLA